MKSKYLVLFASALSLALVLSGCASTGSASGDAADVPAAAPAVDIKSQVGENGLLTPAAILARYVEALGGEAAIRARSSSTAKGKFSMPAMGVEGDTVAYTAAPNKVAINIEMGGMGSMNQGYNGDVGWSDNPMTGPMVLEGDLLDQMKAQADFYAPLTYEARYPTRETVEVTEFNGESAFKVRLVDDKGKESVHYFSEESALLIGISGVQASPMGEAEVTTLFSDYEVFGGIKVPKTTTIQTQGIEIKQTVSEVTYDDVEDGAFDPPASIKALLE